MKTIFDFKRAGLLIQCHFIERFQGELMFWIVSIFCMIFIRNTLLALVFFAIITCVLRTEMFFREIHSPANRINYFMIPATQIEKFVVSLFYAVVYLWVMLFAVYAMGNVLGTWINNLLAHFGLLSGIFGFHYCNLEWVVFSPVVLNTDISAVVMGFLLIQSIFLLGSIYFKKNRLAKTCLALAVILVILLVIAVLEGKYFHIGDTLRMITPKNEIDREAGFLEILKIRTIITNVFYYLLVPYLWLTSYVRLTEKEV